MQCRCKVGYRALAPDKVAVNLKCHWSILVAIISDLCLLIGLENFRDRLAKQKLADLIWNSKHLTKCIDIQIDYDIEETFYHILSGVCALTLKISNVNHKTCKTQSHQLTSIQTRLLLQGAPLDSGRLPLRTVTGEQVPGLFLSWQQTTHS